MENKKTLLDLSLKILILILLSLLISILTPFAFKYIFWESYNYFYIFSIFDLPFYGLITMVVGFFNILSQILIKLVVFFIILLLTSKLTKINMFLKIFILVIVSQIVGFCWHYYNNGFLKISQNKTINYLEDNLGKKITYSFLETFIDFFSAYKDKSVLVYLLKDKPITSDDTCGNLEEKIIGDKCYYLYKYEGEDFYNSAFKYNEVPVLLQYNKYGKIVIDDFKGEGKVSLIFKDSILYKMIKINNEGNDNKILFDLVKK